jgi:hypothetical protein
MAMEELICTRRSQRDGIVSYNDNIINIDKQSSKTIRINKRKERMVSIRLLETYS